MFLSVLSDTFSCTNNFISNENTKNMAYVIKPIISQHYLPILCFISTVGLLQSNIKIVFLVVVINM